jgi:hypothetical protein
MVTEIISKNSISELIVVMVKCGVHTEVRTEFLDIIYMRFGFKRLMKILITVM